MTAFDLEQDQLFRRWLNEAERLRTPLYAIRDELSESQRASIANTLEAIAWRLRNGFGTMPSDVSYKATVGESKGESDTCAS